MLPNSKAIPSNNIICNDFKYTPYNIHNAQPMQYIVYVIQDNPDTFRVLIDLIVWGKNVKVVHSPHA
jgi:hypothetical protein